jgi:hypothetical protein
MTMRRLLLTMLLPLAMLPAHRGDGPVCDRLSVCFQCDDDAVCLIPGLPLPGLPGLG